eukprot:5885368-Prymnesium_polylepis.1
MRRPTLSWLRVESMFARFRECVTVGLLVTAPHARNGSTSAKCHAGRQACCAPKTCAWYVDRLATRWTASADVGTRQVSRCTAVLK